MSSVDENEVDEGELSISEFLTAASKFINEFHWIYNTQLTNILVELTTGELAIPKGFQQYFDINKNPEFFKNVVKLCYGNDRSEPEESEDILGSFINTCKKLTEIGERFILVTNQEKELEEDVKFPTKLKKWKLKKSLEVRYFNEFLGDKIFKPATNLNDHLIIDIGSGVGCLTSSLSNKYKVQVVAIEQKDFRKVECMDSELVSNVQMTLRNDEMSGQLDTVFIEEGLKSKSRISLIGLHSCGDLTPMTLKAFVDSGSCSDKNNSRKHSYKYLAIISCCYHKSTRDFPISNTLKNCIGKLTMNKLFLRLAAQRRGKDFFSKGLEEEFNSVYFRAVLELYFNKKKEKVKKVGKKLPMQQFKCYVEALKDKGLRIEDYAIQELYNENLKWKNSLLAILSLQGAIQRLAELFVLLDRVQYLREHKINAQIINVIPESVSPRGEVIFAQR